MQSRLHFFFSHFEFFFGQQQNLLGERRQKKNLKFELLRDFFQHYQSLFMFRTVRFKNIYVRFLEMSVKMKVIMQVLSALIFGIFWLGFCQSQDEQPVNNSINSECDIPNQYKTKGICVERKNCLDYEDLFNVTELTVERLSFIINLDCGFDFASWKSLVCCPKTGHFYKYVEKVWPSNYFNLRFISLSHTNSW